MPIVTKNADISHLSGWKTPLSADTLISLTSPQDLADLTIREIIIRTKKKEILGTGSNSLFTKTHYDGCIIHSDIRFIRKISEDEQSSIWEVGSGNSWIDTVDTFVNTHHLTGIENLAYIPGSVGAAPIQNIAAYGAVFEDVCEWVDALDVERGTFRRFTKYECDFSYRSSIFKRPENKFRYLITSVGFRLQNPIQYNINLQYHSNYESLTEMISQIAQPPYTVQDAYKAIVAIRSSKLPDWNFIGNNGSVFINPKVKGDQLIKLLKQFPHLQYYPVNKMQYPDLSKIKIEPDHEYKMASGHIFEQLGYRYQDESGNWQVKMRNGVGVWKKHALVVCNYSTQNPHDILEYIQMMQSDFQKATGITLIPEINIID